jgi:hypothetical protein
LQQKRLKNIMENFPLISANYHQAGNIVALVAIAFMVLTSFFAARNIPKQSKAPMQFGINGKPTWFASRLFALWFQPIIAIVILGSFWLMTLNGSGTRPNHELIVFVVRSFTAVVFVLAHGWLMLLAVRFLRRQNQTQATQASRGLTGTLC